MYTNTSVRWLSVIEREKICKSEKRTDTHTHTHVFIRGVMVDWKKIQLKKKQRIPRRKITFAKIELRVVYR